MLTLFLAQTLRLQMHEEVDRHGQIESVVLRIILGIRCEMLLT